MGINIDIFPYDKVSKNEKQAKKNNFQELIYRKLLFLKGTNNPNIPLNGILKIVAKSICWLVHLLLTGFCIPSTLIYNKFLKYCCMSNREDSEVVAFYGEYKTDIGTLSISDIFPLKKVEYEDIEIYVPNNYNKHLKDFYGDYMTIPSQENQINYFPYKIDFDK